ncbi:MAG: energy transducer TonB [Prevotellaceae bacterium]|jgi:protein TonB|nr:energy transducer TonB [Prevotellaceae bacterium]
MFSSKEIKFTSPAWCDYVFAGKNKSYGAYQMRISSSRRHLWAFAITMAAAIATFAIPAAIRHARAANPEWVHETGEIKFTQFDKAAEPQKAIEAPASVPPPPKVIATFAFVRPEMVAATEINPENEFASQEEAAQSEHVIGTHNLDSDIGGTLHPNDVGTVVAMTEQPPKPDKIEIIPARKPEFPGGDKEMYALIGSNLKYPPIALHNRIEGTARIRFVVEKDGSVSEITLLRGFNAACDKEALRVIKLMAAQKWLPGRNEKGDAVRAYFSIPIKFKLQD